MIGNRLAVLSDVHGNIRALDAVLADVRKRGIERIVTLGDSLYGPFDPRRVAERLITDGWPTVAGNEDRCLVEAAAGQPASRTARFAANRLMHSHLEWLAELPRTLEIDDLAYAFHGTPKNDAHYLLSRPTESGTVRPAADDEIARELVGIPQSLILCGHDHRARCVRLGDGRTIVNPGSVGCPAYVDDNPIPHAVESGSPYARYAVVACEKGRVRVEPVVVPYDWTAAADEAARNGFPDWAMWIETGRVRALSA